MLRMLLRLQSYVESSALIVEEAARLTQLGISAESTGLGDIRRELEFRLQSFTERLERTRSSLDLRRRCYQLLDKVCSALAVNVIKFYNF